MWFLIMAIVVNGMFVQAGGKRFETRELCTASLIAWETVPASEGVTNWHGVCIQGTRGKPPLKPGQGKL